MPDRTLTTGFVGTGGDTQYASSKTVTADQWVEGSKSLVGALTDQEEVVPFDKDNVQAIFIVCNEAATVVTNDATNTSAGDTLTFAADVPLIWHVNAPNDNPFTIDVTKFYVSKAATTTGTIKWCIGVNT